MSNTKNDERIVQSITQLEEEIIENMIDKIENKDQSLFETCNKVMLRGKVFSDFEEIYDGAKLYYKTRMKVKRGKGKGPDYIIIHFAADMFNVDMIEKMKNHKMEITGILQSRNKPRYLENGKNLYDFVIATSVNILSEETLKELVNIVSVEGYIGTKPATKIVTYGGKVTNFMFVIRGEKDFIPTYIPVIAWGDKSEQLKNCEVGTKVKFYARMQSRQYIRKKSPKKCKDEVDFYEAEYVETYELSVLRVVSVVIE